MFVEKLLQESCAGRLAQPPSQKCSSYYHRSFGEAKLRSIIETALTKFQKDLCNIRNGVGACEMKKLVFGDFKLGASVQLKYEEKWYDAEVKAISDTGIYTVEWHHIDKSGECDVWGSHLREHGVIAG
eukprot:2190318-Karenia_brevis.AAC.1